MTEFIETVTDCLVFKFEEVEENGNIDMTVYVLYDKRNHKYVLRGRRRWTRRHHSCTYSFECERASDVVDFLQYIICSENTINETLYNYDNFPENSNYITFEFLNNYDNEDYELSGYDGEKQSRQKYLQKLRMLRKISNYF